jgi:hypothetical protein
VHRKLRKIPLMVTIMVNMVIMMVFTDFPYGKSIITNNGTVIDKSSVFTFDGIHGKSLKSIQKPCN